MVLAFAACAALGISASAAAATTSCGRIFVPNGATGDYDSNQVTASGMSCTTAKQLVRKWDLAKIPDWVFAGPNSKIVIYNRYGKRYRFHGYSCQWMNLNPGKSKILPGRGRCKRGSATVIWTYHAAANPRIGKVTGCKQSFAIKPGGSVEDIRAKGVSCSRAAKLIRLAVSRGIISAKDHGFVISARKLDGFRFRYAAKQNHFSATGAKASFNFYLCWYNVNC